MAVRLNRALALPLRHDVSEAWRNTWNICSRSSSCCTCLQLHVKHSSKRNSGRSTYLGNHVSKANDFILGPKRYQQTLSSNFGAQLPSVKQIEHFLSSRKLRFEHGHTSLIASCPFCAKMEGAKEQTGELTLYINKTTGSHFCKGCGSSGTWQEFRTWCLEDHSPESSGKQTAQTHGHSENHADRTTEIWEKSYPLMKSSETVWETVIRQFSIQKLKADILERYKVQVAEHEFKEPDGKTKEHSCIVFPWYDANRAAVKGVKLIKLDDTSDASVTVEPRQGFVGLFGWNTVDPNAKEVVLTSTEFNALAVHQSTSYPAISLPLGTNSLPPEVLPQLEQFEKIILWFGNDLFSRQAANQFSRKLNLKRCYLVRPSGDNPPANALDALNMGCDLNSLLSAAQPISHEKITTFHQLRGEVFDQFVNADQVAGVKWTRFPKMNNILKGLRRGEVTVFTGPTGAGKTTLLSEMSLDLCMQGVNTLWGSFEIRNVRLVKMMMCQYSGLNLENNVPQFQYWADKFEVLPMYFMCFYGAQNINTVIETMSHAAYVYDIEHVVVDNLQFMTSYLSRGDDRFSAQNHVISALRNFASTKNVHVTLVIHPRKENDDVELQTASIFGTAKASQEADNVIILQNKKGNAEKHLQVTKNRFDGVLGRVPLEFVRESLCMSGFGKTLQQKPPLDFNKKRPEKLKATRIVSDEGVVKFSAPKPFEQGNKLNNRNPRWPNPSSNTNIGRSNAEIKGTQISRESFDGNSSSRPNNAVKFEPKVKEDFLSTEKKETVQRTVKKILSGTRLFTKAVNASRSGQGRFERGQAVKKVQDTET